MKSVIARLTLVLLMVALGGSGTSTQTVQLKRVMQTKLAHAQRILGDVVTNDWQGLQTDATALRRATRDPAWAVLVSPELRSPVLVFPELALPVLVLPELKSNLLVLPELLLPVLVSPEFVSPVLVLPEF